MADYDQNGNTVETPAGYVDIPESESSHETVTVVGFDWQKYIGWALLAGLVWMLSQESDESFIRRQYDE